MLTARQYPSRAGINKQRHQCIYPDYYTSTSDVYSTYSDFRYKYSINHIDGILSTSLNPPYIKDGVGVFNPNVYLKSLFGLDFQPEITTFTSCPNSTINYRVDVDEYSKDLVSPDDMSFGKAVIFKNSTEDWDYNEYRMDLGGDPDAGGKFLTKWSTERKVALTGEHGTLRFLSGLQKAGHYPTTENSFCRHILIKVYRGDYKYQYTSQWINPYYSETTIVDIPSDIDDLKSNEDQGKYLLETPCLPEILNTLYWKQDGYTYIPTGTWTSTGTYFSGGVLEEGDTYEYYTFTWPKGVNGITSLPMKFKIESPCANTNTIQIQWENSLGGFDFYTFRKNNMKSINRTSSNYRKVRDTLNSSDYMNHDEFDRGETNYHNKIETNWLVNTDWVTKEEILDLEDLWTSKNIFAYIDGSWYPIISLTNDVLLNTSKTGLRQYSFEFRLSNKKYV